MNLIKPKPLHKGDTIEFIAPAGCVDKQLILNAEKYFNNNGYKVLFGKNLFNRYRYMAGDDVSRAEDIMSAFENPNTDAILCARGGYGSIRLIDKLDFGVIR